MLKSTVNLAMLSDTTERVDSRNAGAIVTLAKGVGGVRGVGFSRLMSGEGLEILRARVRANNVSAFDTFKIFKL